MPLRISKFSCILFRDKIVDLKNKIVVFSPKIALIVAYQALNISIKYIEIKKYYLYMRACAREIELSYGNVCDITIFRIYLMLSPKRRRRQLFSKLVILLDTTIHTTIHRTGSYSEQKKNFFSSYVLCITQCAKIGVASFRVPLNFLFLRFTCFICMHSK